MGGRRVGVDRTWRCLEFLRCGEPRVEFRVVCQRCGSLRAIARPCPAVGAIGGGRE
jgi:hypothetical protein